MLGGRAPGLGEVRGTITEGRVRGEAQTQEDPGGRCLIFLATTGQATARPDPKPTQQSDRFRIPIAVVPSKETSLVFPSARRAAQLKIAGTIAVHTVCLEVARLK
jgi:hypothetical protein